MRHWKTRFAPRLAGAALCLLAALPVQGSGFPDGIPGDVAQRLVMAALSAAGQHGHAVPRPVRPLPACQDQPAVTAGNDGWSLAQITCADPVWTRALRTGASAPRLRTKATPAPDTVAALVLTRSLPKGAMLTADDLTPGKAAGLGPDEIFVDATLAAGRRLRVAVGLGKPLLLRHLEPDWQVREGAPVSISAGRTGFVVTTMGEAMASGSLGDVIDVQNRTSGRVLKATVTGKNSVTAFANIPG